VSHHGCLFVRCKVSQPDAHKSCSQPAVLTQMEVEKKEAKRKRDEGKVSGGGKLPKRAKGAKKQWWEDSGADGCESEADDDVDYYTKEVLDPCSHTMFFELHICPTSANSRMLCFVLMWMVWFGGKGSHVEWEMGPL
jgi:hypothetical protein